MEKLLRQLPPIHELQKNDAFQLLIEKFAVDSKQLTSELKKIIEWIRTEINNKSWRGPFPGSNEFINWVFNYLDSEMTQKMSHTLIRVINATGTILHTNLGRARLSFQAIERVIDIAQNYSNLEYQIEQGKRGSRHSHVESLVTQITGAEAAMVVNNNAAAVYLILRALSKGKEVIVSRGQLVEIGGSFRISSIMEESGANLIEVGTTNKTYIHDYEEAITEETSMILKVHTSNFKIIGFTKEVKTEELAQLAKKHSQLVFYEDLGSGVLYDFNKHGLGNEPVVSEVLKSGADIVSFSGDKLLGGPQAGIIAGKKALIDRLKKHQLARVLRIDKMTLAALEGTLIDYLKSDKGKSHIPVIRDLLTTKEELLKRTERFLHKLHSKTNKYKTSIIDGISQVGGGTMPDVEIPTVVVVAQHETYRAEELARLLRVKQTPPIIVRIQNESINIDLRTVSANEEELIIDALINLS